MQCIKCNERPIEIKRWLLCKRCYGQAKTKQIIPSVLCHTEKDKQEFLKQNLLLKYGDEIFNDIEQVKMNKFFTMADVGRKYNISRERVRQIFQILNGEAYTVYKRKFRTVETGCVRDPRQKIANYLKGSKQYTGAVAEKIFFDKCIELGFLVSTACNQTVDLIVNGYRIDVKSASVARSVSNGNKKKYFCYGSHGKQTRLVDFYACYHPVEKCFYIIPNNYKGTDKAGKAKSIYLSERLSGYHTERNPNGKYKNAFWQFNVLIDEYFYQEAKVV